MNHSFRSADRATYIKVVVVAVFAAIVVVVAAVSARVDETGNATARIQGPALKAGKPATYTGSDTRAIR
jgi:hypothetical protein